MSPGGIALTVSIGERPQDFDTQLDPEGWLMDVERLVANGYHSATCCAACDELLVDFEFSEDEAPTGQAVPTLGARHDKNGTSVLEKRLTRPIRP